jgi:hypothetical protein
LGFNLNIGTTKVRIKNGIITGYVGAPSGTDIDVLDIAGSPMANHDGFPDKFDGDVMIHEIGHRIEKQLNFFNSSPGGNHSWTSLLSDTFAASEAFGDLLFSMVTGKTKWYNSFQSNTDSFMMNIETGQYGETWVGGTETVVGTANCLGGKNECSVAGALWDIMDIQNDDTSSRANWGDTILSHHHKDSIGDALAVNSSTVFSVLSNRSIDGHHPRNISEFWRAWFGSPSIGYTTEMRNIYYEHGVCCMGTTGNVNLTLGVDLADMSMLTSYLSTGSPVLPCPSAANINATGGIDLADLSALMNYLTGGGFVLPTCP